MIERWEQTAASAMLRHMKREVRELRKVVSELENKKHLFTLDERHLLERKLKEATTERDRWKKASHEYYERICKMAEEMRK